MPEFGPCKARSSQYLVKVAASIELKIKGPVAHQHRLEECKATGRFPQPEMFDISELAARRDPKRPSPQSDEQRSADQLNATNGRKSGDGTQGSGLHRRTEIATRMRVAVRPLPIE